MAEKIVFVAFSGAKMAIVHVFLNALEMKAKGFTVKIIIEGEATKYLQEFNNPKDLFHGLYTKVKKAKLIDCVCESCSKHASVNKSIIEQGFETCNEMEGHPPISKYIEKGFKVITF